MKGNDDCLNHLVNRIMDEVKEFGSRTAAKNFAKERQQRKKSAYKC